ncbi:MAG: endonuclease III [Nitrospinae bacterium]|nr:endonuclease III [Nitrospinota bacterium]
MPTSSPGRLLRILEQTYPDARCALNYRNSLELLVATMLSAQCTDERVNMVTPALFARYPDAASYAEAVPAELEKLIHSCGFYRQKAKSIRACCRRLADEFGGEVPAEMEHLVSLPGVGRKTANVVLNEAYGEPAIAVDTHVLRTANRLGWISTRDPVKAEFQLLDAVPKKWWGRVTLLLIHHGRNCCSARKPLCADCTILKGCPHGRESLLGG